jgi:hypothetical protein
MNIESISKASLISKESIKAEPKKEASTSENSENSAGEAKIASKEEGKGDNLNTIA